MREGRGGGRVHVDAADTRGIVGSAEDEAVLGEDVDGVGAGLGDDEAAAEDGGEAGEIAGAGLVTVALGEDGGCR